jgi:hypothetical protein
MAAPTPDGTSRVAEELKRAIARRIASQITSPGRGEARDQGPRPVRLTTPPTACPSPPRASAPPRRRMQEAISSGLMGIVAIIGMVAVTSALICFQILTWPLRVVVGLVCLVTGRSVLTGRPYRHHRHDPEIYVTRQQRAAFTRKMNREAQRRAQEKGRST